MAIRSDEIRREMCRVKRIAEIAAKEIQGFSDLIAVWLLLHLLPQKLL